MSRCTKARCPMKFGTVTDDCDLKDCMYRIDLMADRYVSLVIRQGCSYEPKDEPQTEREGE